MQILLKELDPGQKYILQARAKSATGKTSPWSTAFEHTTTSDTVAPSPVTSLSWVATGTSFNGTWVKPATDSNGKPLKDFKDYKVELTAGATTVVYFTNSERFDFTFEANRNAFGTPQASIQISIKVRDTVGNLSTAVTATATNPVPANVTGFTATASYNGVSLTWTANADSDFKYYKLYMSTSGSGFTPGPSNLVYTGSNTAFTFFSVNFVPHYFKIQAVDAFDQVSASFAAANATPLNSTSIDLTAPGAPATVTVSTTAASDGSSNIAVSWSAVGSSNLSDYVVRYSTDQVAWIYLNAPAGQTSATIKNLLPSTSYYVQVAGMSYANVKSSYTSASTYPITTAADTTAPSQPSAPTISIGTQSAQVSHAMTKQAGGNLEADVDYLEVHASTTTGFTPNNSTLQGTIWSAAQGISVSSVFYFPSTDSTANLYWKIIAVDKAKNKSTASNQATGLPGLVANANIANATITSAKISDLEANKITAGTGIINNLAIKSTLTIDTAGFLQSSNWNGSSTGYRLDTTGLTIFNGSISAAALLLQDSANLMPPAFADFEFNEDYYHTGGTANSVVWSTSGGAVTVDIYELSKKFGQKSLRLTNGTITNPTVHNIIFAPGGFVVDGNGIEVDPGDYIVSFYAKKQGTPNMNMTFGIYTDGGASIPTSVFAVSSTSWTRYTGVITVPSGVSKVKPYITVGPQSANTGYDVLIDGVQIERKLTGSTTASNYRPPSSTAINGGQIVTGSIRSSAFSPVVATQPAWSINMAGNMQIGDALVRGSMVVGLTSAPSNLLPAAFTSFENSSDYYHDAVLRQNDANFNAADFAVLGTQKIQIISDAVFGTQALRLFDTTNPSTNVYRNIAFTNLRLIPAGNNINIIAGRTYWVSAYFKNRLPAKQLKVGFAVYHDNGYFITAMPSGDVDISSYTSYTRVSGKWTAPAGRSNCHIVLYITPIGTSSGYDISMDGFMVELGQIGQVAPSTYTDSVGELSYVRSGNYVSGFAGWSIGNDGTAEFNDGFFRGQLDVSSFFNGVPFGTNITTAPAVWRSNLWSSYSYQVAGVQPTVKLYGSGFKPNSSGGLSATTPFQVVFRGTPEGGYQLMADGTNLPRIYLEDSNNDLDSFYNPINDVYGYADLRAGRGLNRDFTALAASNLLQNDNLFYTQMQTKSQARHMSGGTGIDDVHSEAKSGLMGRTDASPLAYQFLPQSYNALYAESTMLANAGNLIPDPWDIFDGTLATYNSNSTKNRVTLNSVSPFQSPTGPITPSLATSGTINGLTGTFLLAGTGDHIVYFSPTDTTYNVTVTPGAEYSMALQMQLPTSLIGKQFQFLMKLSNGTLLSSSLVTLDSSNTTGLGFVSNQFGMGYANVFSIPAGITTALVGFRLVGGVAANTTFGFAGGILYKTRHSDGKYFSQYNRYIQIPRNKSFNYTSRAEIQVSSIPLPPDIWYDGDVFGNGMSNIRLLATREDLSPGGDYKEFQMSITPDGVQWGKDTEYRPMQGFSIRTTTASIFVINGGGTVELPTTSGTPGPFNLITSKGTNFDSLWDAAGSLYTTTAPTGITVKKAGLYLVSVWASAGSTAVGQYLDITNASTGVRYAIGGLPPGTAAADLSVVGIVPCNAGERIGVRYLNYSASGQTLTQYRITMSQLI